MRFSVDTNVLVYALEQGNRRTALAERILVDALGCDCVLTNQALGECLNATRRRFPALVPQARQAVESWSVVFPVAPTSTEQLIRASALAERHRLQFWDSVILTVAGDAGAEFLLSEDMQDGAMVDGVRLLNPFNPANTELLDLLLTPSP